MSWQHKTAAEIINLIVDLIEHPPRSPKIAIIKIIRMVTGASLRDARNIVELYLPVKYQ